MTDDPRSHPIRPDRLRRAYERLFAFYPADFRARYGEDLLQAFDDRRGEPRFSGTLGGIRLMAFLARDFVMAVPLAQTNTEERRGMGGIMNDILRDLRFSVRMLLKNPAFTIAAVLTLALGIGMNAATFSTVHSLLLRPLPGAESPDRLVQLYREWPGIEYGANSPPHYQDVRDRSGDFLSDVASWYFEPISVASDGRSERTMALIVSANFFQTYGVQPQLGRAFLPGVEDRDPGAHPVAIISDGFWKARFGGDPSIVGETIRINGLAYEVVGISPPDFGGPMSVARPPVYLPLMMADVIRPGFNRLEIRGNNFMNVVARMAEGADVDRVRAGMEVMLAQLREELPDSYEDQLGTTAVLQSEAGIHPSFGNAQNRMSSVMMAVVGLLLLIACVNVANLFLARARDRQREMGIRLSMGAGRGRIVQQLLTESVLFSFIAGIAGLGLAYLATKSLAAFRPPIDGPWAFGVEMDSTVLGFTFAISVLAGLVFGMAPALQSARPDVARAVKDQGAKKPGGSRVSRGLVVAQVALSLILLVSSGLFLRALQAATAIDPGFDEPAGIAMASVDPQLQGYDEARSREFWDRMLEDVEALPEVEAAGLTLTAPLGLGSSDRYVEVPGYDFAEGERQSLHYSYASEGYLETMGIDVVEGRTFTRADDSEAAPVMIVNQRFAERFWPEESALGKTVDTAGESWEVIGVVETGKYESLGEEPREFMYFPYRYLFRADMILVARVSGDAQVVLQRIRGLVQAADPDMPVFDVRSMEDHMGIALLPARLGGSVLGLFGLLGLTLAAVGIYGVMAYSVSQRRRELGIRVALGADRAVVLRLVLTEGMRLALLGTVVGLAVAFGVTRFMEGMLYDVQALDPVAFTLVPLTLIGVAALAVYLPARRAARIDPIGALKSE